MKLLRFYHLGVTQMHQLDGNSSELSQMVREIDAHREAMEQRGLDIEQTRLDPAWLERVKAFKA
jgi:cytochrome c biogenesis protein ResB